MCFSCGYFTDFQDCVLGCPRPLSINLHTSIWLRSYTRILDLNLNLGCFAVSSGRRHRYRMYASVTHTHSFSHHRQIYLHLLDEGYRFCQLLECPSCEGEAPLGELLFHQYCYWLSYGLQAARKLFLKNRRWVIVSSPSCYYLIGAFSESQLSLRTFSSW